MAAFFQRWQPVAQAPVRRVTTVCHLDYFLSPLQTKERRKPRGRLLTLPSPHSFHSFHLFLLRAAQTQDSDLLEREFAVRSGRIAESFGLE